MGFRGSYDFEEGSGSTTADASGSGNTLTLNGSGVSWTTAGHSGGALNFDGASGYVEAADSSTLNPREELTISAWVYQMAGNASGDNTIAVKETQYGLWIVNGQLQMAVQTATGPVWRYTGSGAVPLNTWTHVKGTYDGVALRTFVNGQLTSFTPYANGVIKRSANPLRIGSRPQSGYFAGRIDEVRIIGLATGETNPGRANLITVLGPGLGDYRNDTSVTAGSWWQVPNRTLPFTKRVAASFLKITYQDTLGTNANDYGVCDWRILLDNSVISEFSDADITAPAAWRMSNAAHVAIASGIPPGAHQIRIENRRATSATECLQGWNTSGNFIMVEEIP
jgi:hypothetical protein